jgi:hypothetical protein
VSERWDDEAGQVGPHTRKLGPVDHMGKEYRSTKRETDSMAPRCCRRLPGLLDWILLEETVALPASGTYYVVTWDPGHMTGKLTVAVGMVEQFGLAEILRLLSWLSDARAFHEMDRFAPDTPIEEQSCPRQARL